MQQAGHPAPVGRHQFVTFAEHRECHQQAAPRRFVTEATGAAQQLTPSETDAVQDAAALTAWWAFATMVLGAVGAIAGGKLGSEHPDWHARERMERPTTLADRL